jgi:hypothetical protein
MFVQSGLVIPREYSLIRIFRRLFDDLARKIDEDFQLVPTNALDPLR